MKKIVLAVMGVMVGAGANAGAPDWSKVPERKVKLFYPGQSSLEWVMNKADHSAVPDIVDKKRSCAKCHEGDANEIGDKIVAGKPVGSSKGLAGAETACRQGGLDSRQLQGRARWREDLLPLRVGTAEEQRRQDGQEE